MVNNQHIYCDVHQLTSFAHNKTTHCTCLLLTFIYFQVSVLTNLALCYMQVWFEVSAHTNRVHFHADKDGSQPLGLSLPIGCLQGSETAASVQDLLEAVDERC